MTPYLIRRALSMIPVFFIVTAGTFFLLQATGADAAVTIAGGEASVEEIEAVRAEYGLDDPLPKRYLQWLANAAQGDLGTSVTKAREPVGEQIRARLPVTIELAILALVIAVVVSVPLGIVSAIWRNSPWDYGASFIALVGVSVPGFALAFIAIYTFSVQLGWIPIYSYTSPWESPLENLKVMIIPASVLGAEMAGILARLTRSSMLEVLRDDYVRTARSKGLGEIIVVRRHALRNALLPVLTVIGVQFATLVGGSFVIEVVFGLPGTGQLLVNAINGRDIYVIQGMLLLMIVTFVTVNLLVDVSYTIVDPRVRLG